MSDPRWLPYHFAILRVVPHVHLGQYVNIGAMVHARTSEYLGVRIVEGPSELKRRIPDIDAEMLEKYLACFRRICDGDASAGPVALLPTSERFHWLTAPRSDVLQTSPVHEGLTLDPARALDELFVAYVGSPNP